MKINKLYTVFFILAAALLVVACSEYEDTVVPSPTVSADNPAVRFYSENPTQFELDPNDLSFSLTVVRDNGTAAIEVPVNVVADTASIFNVPGTLSFPAGVDTVSLTITVNTSAPQGEDLGLEIAFDDQYTNPYKAEYPSFKTAIFIKPPCPFNEVILNLVFDDYASETSWDLKDNTDAVIASGGPWEDGAVAASEKFCLEDGTYTFTLYDGYGDGISAPGSATITSNGTELVYIEGDFGTSKIETFTVTK